MKIPKTEEKMPTMTSPPRDEKQINLSVEQIDPTQVSSSPSLDKLEEVEET
jgi:hypothetical protein